MAAATLISACQGAHLYAPEKDTLATEINAAFKETNPKNVLETHKQNLEKLADAERKVAADSVLFIRDTIIWHLANGRSTGSLDETDLSDDLTLGQQLLPDFTDSDSSYAGNRLDELGIKSQTDLADAVDAVTIRGSGSLVDDPGTLLLSSKQILRDKNALREQFEWKDVWDCETAVEKSADDAAREAGVDDSRRIAFDAIFERYQDPDCKTYLEQSENPDIFTQPPGIFSENSKLAETFHQWMDDRETIEQLKTARKDAAKKLKELKDAMPASTADEDTFIQKLQDEADNISELLTKATTDDAQEIIKRLGLSEVFASDRVTRLGYLLNAVHTGSLDGLTDEELDKLNEDPEFKQSLVLAAGLPGVGEKVETLIDILRRPEARTDLLILFSYQKARADYLRKRTQLIEERATLRQELLRSLLREVFFLYRCQQFVEQTNPDTAESLASQKLEEVMKNGNALDKQRLYEALISFDHSLSVARKRSEEIRSDLANFGSRENTLANEYALDSWNALLQGPINQLAAFHKAGIKPEAVADAVAGLASLGLLGYVAVKEVN